MEIILSFIAGAFIGATVGIMVMALCVAASADNDEMLKPHSHQGGHLQ